MSSVVISGDTSGSITLAAPAVAGSNTVTLPAITDTLVGLTATQTLTNKTIQGGAITSGTAQTSTSGTSIDFTGVPSWVKRITVMFNGVSTSGTSNIQIQLGTGATPTYTTSGYGNIYSILGATTTTTTSATSGFVCIVQSGATAVSSGQVIISNISGNTWAESGQVGETNGTRITSSAGAIALGAALTAVRITTVNGTDTFDAGSINIIYE